MGKREGVQFDQMMMLEKWWSIHRSDPFLFTFRFVFFFFLFRRFHSAAEFGLKNLNGGKLNRKEILCLHIQSSTRHSYKRASFSVSCCWYCCCLSTLLPLDLFLFRKETPIIRKYRSLASHWISFEAVHVDCRWCWMCRGKIVETSAEFRNPKKQKMCKSNESWEKRK